MSESNIIRPVVYKRKKSFLHGTLLRSTVLFCGQKLTHFARRFSTYAETLTHKTLVPVLHLDEYQKNLKLACKSLLVLNTVLQRTRKRSSYTVTHFYILRRVPKKTQVGM